VDEYVKEAVRRLGAADRFAAARLAFAGPSPSDWGAGPPGDETGGDPGQEAPGMYGGRIGEPGPDGGDLRGDASGGAIAGGDRSVRGALAGAAAGRDAVSGRQLAPAVAPDRGSGGDAGVLEIAREALAGLRKLSPWMPAEMVLRRAMVIAWAAMDEQLCE